jgi:hypothetical protein
MNNTEMKREFIEKYLLARCSAIEGIHGGTSIDFEGIIRDAVRAWRLLRQV